MGVILPVHILTDVSFALVEDVVNTTLNPLGGNVAAGVNVVTPGSMAGIYEEALLVIGAGGTIEVVQVVSVTASTFTANFLKAHAAADPVFAPTFPSGQTDHPLFTQTEMLGYLAERQNEFLMRVRPVYADNQDDPIEITAGTRIYAAPDDAIRMERVSIEGKELYETTQTDLDWKERTWQNSARGPRYWYQDKVGVQQFGLGPPPKVGAEARVFYSQRGGTALDFLTPLTVPDIMTYALKWGVLGMALSKDGEQRDDARAKYCQQRFDFTAFLAGKFMDGIMARFKQAEETVEPLVGAQRTA